MRVQFIGKIMFLDIVQIQCVKQLYKYLIGRKRDVYICTPMCASARVASSNIVYLEYEYRSTGTRVLNTEIDL